MFSLFYVTRELTGSYTEIEQKSCNAKRRRQWEQQQN